MDGNLATLNKLVRKGKADADVLEDRLRKVRSLLHYVIASCSHADCGQILAALLNLMQVDEVRAAIEAIPDGVHGRAQLSPSKLRPGGEAGPSKGPINIEARAYGDGHFTSTAESSKFRQVSRMTLTCVIMSLTTIHQGSARDPLHADFASPQVISARPISNVLCARPASLEIMITTLQQW